MCNPAGQVGQCRYSCAIQAEGPPAPCPAGWNCGHDDICRAHKGDFGTPAYLQAAAGKRLAVADFDGDGFDDVSWLYQTHVHTTYFEKGNPVAGSSLGFEMPSLRRGTATVFDVDGDGRADWSVPARAGLAVMRGSGLRVTEPTTFISLQIGLNAGFGFVPIDLVPDLVGAGGAVHSFAGDETLTLTQFGLFTFDSNIVVEPMSIGAVDLSAGSIAAELDKTSGPLLPAGSPTPQELVLALPNKPAAIVFRPTLQQLADGVLTVDMMATPPATITLDSDAGVGRMLGAVQLNPPVEGGLSAIPCGNNKAPGDDHIDLAFEGKNGGIYVAFSSGSGTLGATPCDLDPVVSIAKRIAPSCSSALALGQLDGDGLVDIVTASGIWLSRLGPMDKLCTDAVSAVEPPAGSSFVEAVIADFDGDGQQDVLASSSAGGFDLYRGSGGTTIGHSRIPSDAIASRLVPGDFDGNGINDLVFVSPASLSGERDALSVMFGEPQALPSNSVRMGTVGKVTLIEALDLRIPNEVLVDAASDLVLGADIGDALGIALVFGSTDRLLQAPYLQAFNIAPCQRYRPKSAVYGHFDSTDNLQVALVGERTASAPDGYPADPPLYSLAISDVADDELSFSMRGDYMSDIWFAERTAIPLHGDGTGAIASAAIDLDQNGFHDLVVLASTAQEPFKTHVYLPRPKEDYSWAIDPPRVIDDAVLFSDGLGGDDVVAKWSRSGPTSMELCQLKPKEPPLLLMALARPVSCGDSMGFTTVLMAASATALLDSSAALEPVDVPVGETVMGFTCANLDDDPEGELAVLTLTGSVGCGGDTSLDRAAHLYVVDSIEEELRERVVELDKTALASLGVNLSQIPPVAGLAAGDLNADGVVDLVFGAHGATVILPGTPINP